MVGIETERTTSEREPGLVAQTLRNWVRTASAGMLNGPGSKPVTAYQLELSRLRADDAQPNMHVGILEKATAYFAKEASIPHRGEQRHLHRCR